MGAIECAPGATFCDADGQTMWSCTKSGTDAVFAGSCANYAPNTGNSPTNPFVCATTNCPAPSSMQYSSYPGPACCRGTRPYMTGSLTQPPTGFSYQNWEPSDPSGQWGGCSIGSYTSSCSSTVYVFSAGRIVDSGNAFKVQLATDSATLNGPVTLPPAAICGVSALNNISLTVGGITCTQWSGTVTLVALPPKSAFAIDITCTETGKTSMKLVGTFSQDP